MSSFAKFIIMGESRSVVSYLQSLCSNDVDIPVGGIIPTGMLNENGMKFHYFLNVSFYHQEIMINEHLKIFEIKSNSSFSRWLRKRLSPDSPKRLFILYGQPDSTADPNLAVDEQPPAQRQLSCPSRRHLHVHRPLSGRT
jgi:hypothetical protein